MAHQQKAFYILSLGSRSAYILYTITTIKLIIIVIIIYRIFDILGSDERMCTAVQLLEVIKDQDEH